MLVIRYTLVARYFTVRPAQPATDIHETRVPVGVDTVHMGPDRARRYFGLLSSVCKSSPSTLEALRTGS
jgi:hypothetical protein